MQLEEIAINKQLPSQPIRNRVMKKKGFWDSTFKNRKLNRPNYVAVIFLRNNGIAEPMEAESKDGFFNIHGKSYHERRDCVWRFGKDKTPLCIIPENNLTPLGTKEWEDRPMQEKFSELQDHVLKGIRHAEIVKAGGLDGPKMSGKAIIGLIIVGIIGIAILSNYI